MSRKILSYFLPEIDEAATFFDSLQKEINYRNLYDYLSSNFLFYGSYNDLNLDDLEYAIRYWLRKRESGNEEKEERHMMIREEIYQFLIENGISTVEAVKESILMNLPEEEQEEILSYAIELGDLSLVSNIYLVY